MQAIAAMHNFPAIPRAGRRIVAAAPVTAAVRLPTQCCNCNLRGACLPCGLDKPVVARMDELVFTRQRLKKGQHVFRAADKFTSLYAVRSGSFTSRLTLEDGRDQVTGFFMPGEMMGMDGIDGLQHTCDVVALEDSEVCVIQYAHLEQMSREIPALQQHFHRMMGREITRDYGLMLLLGSMRAEERLAMFLLNLSQRYAARGYSATQFNLRMTREEIGSYLGLKLETVSRAFSRFHDDGLISVLNRQIDIRDPAGLKAVIGDYDKPRSPPLARRANRIALNA